MTDLIPEEPVVIALALGALLASLSSIVTSACRDMFDFEIFDLRDDVGNWAHPGRAGTLARRRLPDTSLFIAVLYMTSFVILLYGYLCENQTGTRSLTLDRLLCNARCVRQSTPPAPPCRQNLWQPLGHDDCAKENTL